MYIAYTDGSYLRADNSCGFGIYLYDSEHPENYTEIYGRELRSDHLAMWNVGGEIAAVEYLLDYCIENHITKIRICHDYNGLGHWARGTWKRNKPATIAYANKIKMLESVISMEFYHVKGHSGNKYNARADQLANLGRHAEKVEVIKHGN